MKVPGKQPKRGRLWLNDGSCIRLRSEHKDRVWSYDFVAARTSDGRGFRILAILAGCGRKVRRSAAVYGASTVSAAFGM